MAEPHQSAPVEDRAHPARTGAGALLAAAGAVAMAGVARALAPDALTGGGEQALMSGLLVLLAAAGALLCLYLALVWTLATAALLAGPASMLGRAMLTPLRVLAPQLARRVVVSAALGTAATAMVLGPASAADQSSTFLDLSTVSAGTMQEIGADGSAEDLPTSPAADEPSSDTAPAEGADDLPPLGWEGTPTSEGSTPQQEQETTPQGQESTAQEDDSTPRSPEPAPRDGDAAGQDRSPAGSSAPRTLVVEEGDTLWSLTDEALGPGPDSPTDIATAWPRLYDTNRTVIGEDPAQRTPGQVLTVPAAFADEEPS